MHILLFGAQLRMTTKLTYVLTRYYTLNDSFTANDASFIRTKLASYTVACSAGLLALYSTDMFMSDNVAVVPDCDCLTIFGLWDNLYTCA